MSGRTVAGSAADRSWPDEQFWAEWSALLDQSPEQTLFLTRPWLESWFRVHGQGREPMFIAFRDAAGALVGAAALMRQRSRTLFGLGWEMRFLSDGTGDSDALSVIAKPGRHVAVAEALERWLAENAGRWNLLALETLPAAAPATHALEARLRGRGWLRERSDRARLVLDLPADWPTYLAGLTQNARTALTYKPRRLERRHEVAARRVVDPEEHPRVLEALFELNTRRWKSAGEPGNFDAPGRRALYRRLAAALHRERLLDLWLLELDGVPAAVHFGARYAGVHYVLESGFAPELAPLSVGSVLTAHLLRALIDAKVARVDFQGGDEAYKLRLGARASAYVSLRCVRRGSLASGLLRARGWQRALRRRGARP